MRDATEVDTDGESRVLAALPEQAVREFFREVDESLSISSVELALALSTLNRLLESNESLLSSTLNRRQLHCDAAKIRQMLDNIQSMLGGY